MGRARGDPLADHRGGPEDRPLRVRGARQFYGDESGLTLPIVNEELFWGDAGIGMAIMGTSLAVAAIFGQGTGEQIGEWIPQCFGTPEDPAVAAFCVSEPDAGSDVSSLRTRAVYDEAKDEWVINGQKAWATNGGIAGVHVVVASVDKELGSRGQAAFVVPPGTAGLTMGTKVKKHGLRASHTADVFLDDCRVPGSCLLGGKEKLDERMARAREGTRSRGQAAMQTFEASRPTVGAQAIGIARAAYEYALNYAGERVQFGKPIIDNQAIAFTLADMKMEIDAARLLVWRASWMGRQGQTFENAEGSMSKLKAGEVAVWATERAIQILGGNGYTRSTRGALASRREDLHDLRGHLGDPAAGRRARHLGAADPVTPPRGSVVRGSAADVSRRSGDGEPELAREAP
jgi:acyl-CoA dehydrogenase